MFKRGDLLVLGAVLAFITVIVCSSIGIYTNRHWLIFLGFGLFIVAAFVFGGISFSRLLKRIRKVKKQQKGERTQEEETALLKKVNESKDYQDNIVAQYEYYTYHLAPKETMKESWKLSTKRSKRIFIFVLILVVLLLIAFLGGMVLRRYRWEGFILMFTGFCGIFLLLFISAFHSVGQRRRYFNKHKVINSLGKVRRLQGVVLRCLVHSSHSTGFRRARIISTLYNMQIKPNDGGENFWLVGGRLYQKDEQVYYYENIKRPRLKYIED